MRTFRPVPEHHIKCKIDVWFEQIKKIKTVKFRFKYIQKGK